MNRRFLEDRLVIASHNAGKVTEFADLLAPLDIAVESAADLGLPEPVEDGTTFADNAVLKAIMGLENQIHAPVGNILVKVRRSRRQDIDDLLGRYRGGNVGKVSEQHHGIHLPDGFQPIGRARKAEAYSGKRFLAKLTRLNWVERLGWRHRRAPAVRLRFCAGVR